MLLPSFIFGSLASAAAGFLSSSPHGVKDDHSSYATNHHRRPSSSRHRRNIVIAAVLLLLATTIPQSGAQSSSTCGCQFDHACFPADGSLLKSAVDAYTGGNWLGTISGTDYGLNISEWCTNLVTNMKELFYDKENFDANLSLWNTASVTTMNGMFYDAPAFTGDGIGLWDTSRVIDMNSMFFRAYDFTGDGIGSWNVTVVTDMGWMFGRATSFAEDGIKEWDTGSVLDMSNMFYLASSFTGDGIGQWEIASVTKMRGMFNSASSFNENLCAWSDKFPFNNSANIFTNSGCTFTATPNEVDGGPFCAHDCVPSAQPSTSMEPSASAKPSSDPTVIPSLSPSTSVKPSTPPTLKPSTTPSLKPSTTTFPSMRPSFNPSVTAEEPSWNPSTSMHPSLRPSFNPSPSSPCGCQFDHTCFPNKHTLKAAVDAFTRGDWGGVISGVNYGLNISEWCTGFVTNMGYLFFLKENFDEDISLWNTASVTGMFFMFQNASSFTGGGIGQWDVSSVNNMYGMFAYASSFTGGEGIGQWDVASVTNMRQMFWGASSFTGDGIESWNTSKVDNMNEMFYDATSFNENLCAWRNNFPYDNAANIFTNSSCTFTATPNEANLGPFCTSDCGAPSAQPSTSSGPSLKPSSSMRPSLRPSFNPSASVVPSLNPSTSLQPSTSHPCGCQFDHECFPANGSLLRSAVLRWSYGNWGGVIDGVNYGLNISEWCTGLVTDMEELFYDTYLDANLSLWNTASVTSMYRMFYETYYFTGDGIGQWDTSKVTNMGEMFWDAPDFIEDGIGSWNVSSVTNMYEMFAYATSFTGDGIGSWDITSVKDLRYMFYDASSFTGDGIGNWDVASVTNMRGMFWGASSFTGDGIGSWDVASVTDMGYMFYKATSFNEELSQWNTTSSRNMAVMFRGASSFTGDGIGEWDVASVTTIGLMFAGASSFTGDGIGQWDVASVTNMYGMFLNTSSFTGEGIGSWNVASVTNMGDMFRGASSFTGEGIGSWDIASVNDMCHMFNRASSFNENLCAWSVNFPYNKSVNIFNNSGCTFTATPNEVDGGPFCADDCGPSAKPSLEPSLQPSETPPPQFQIEFTSTVTIGTTTQNVTNILFSDTGVLEEFLAAIEAQIRSNICPVDSLTCKVTILTVNGESVGETASGAALVELSLKVQTSSTDLVIEFVTNIRGICDTEDCSNADTLGALLYLDATNELNGALLDNSFLSALKAALSAYQDIQDILHAASVTASFGELVLTPYPSSSMRPSMRPSFSPSSASTEPSSKPSTSSRPSLRPSLHPSTSAEPSTNPSGSPSQPVCDSPTKYFTNTDENAKEKAKGIMYQMLAKSSNVVIEKVSFKTKDVKDTEVQLYFQLGSYATFPSGGMDENAWGEPLFDGIPVLTSNGLKEAILDEVFIIPKGEMASFYLAGEKEFMFVEGGDEFDVSDETEDFKLYTGFATKKLFKKPLGEANFFGEITYCTYTGSETGPQATSTPSMLPSISKLPSMSPSNVIVFPPPSMLPSNHPSLSPTPEVTSTPSMLPSISKLPTTTSTASPSPSNINVFPSMLPSIHPSLSPTADEVGYTTPNIDLAKSAAKGGIMFSITAKSKQVTITGLGMLGADAKKSDVSVYYQDGRYDNFDALDEDNWNQVYEDKIMLDPDEIIIVDLDNNKLTIPVGGTASFYVLSKKGLLFKTATSDEEFDVYAESDEFVLRVGAVSTKKAFKKPDQLGEFAGTIVYEAG